MVRQTSLQGSHSSVNVVLCVRNLFDSHTFSSTVLYESGDTIEVKIDVHNTSAENITHLFVSHMLRDAIAYVPNTLKVSKGEAEMLYRVIRWRIFNLKSDDFAELSFQARILNDYEDAASILLGASYTYQEEHMVSGTYKATGATLENRKRNL